MASRKDLEDMLGGVASDAAHRGPAPKKQKATQQKRLTGLGREVEMLIGDRTPPVAVLDAQKSFRPKRHTGPAKNWVQQPFTNPARADGLILKHWRRKPIAKNLGVDGEAMEDIDGQLPLVEAQYEFAKYNVQAEGPQYDDAQYETHLQSDSWSKEETDYLVELVKEYYQRWPIVADRYDFHPAQNSDIADTTALVPAQKERTMEEMKARYYLVCAKCMELQTPISNMTIDEFALHEILSKYSPDSEINRKRLAAGLLARSVEEVKEEEFLLAELQRITISANKLDAERAEIRARLEAPKTTNDASSTQYQSSAALQALFQQLFQQDRSKRPRPSGTGSVNGHRLSLSAADLIPSPAGGHGTPTSAHRDSIAVGTNKKGSAQPPTPATRLNPKISARYGITEHERLTGGITFRSDRLLKLRQAKSAIQTQKIAAALTELAVPELIAVPTTKVCEVYETLVNKVTKLLDVRKVREKEENELKVLEAQRDELLKKNGEKTQDEQAPPLTNSEKDAVKAPDAEGDAEGDADAEVDDGDADADVDGDGDGDADADGEAEPTPSAAPTQDEESSAGLAASSNAGHKRSASVLSQASSKSSKRARK